MAKTNQTEPHNFKISRSKKSFITSAFTLSKLQKKRPFTQSDNYIWQLIGKTNYFNGFIGKEMDMDGCCIVYGIRNQLMKWKRAFERKRMHPNCEWTIFKCPSIFSISLWCVLGKRVLCFFAFFVFLGYFKGYIQSFLIWLRRE